MILRDNGMVYFAPQHYTPNGLDKYVRLGAWDSLTNSMIYQKAIVEVGTSAALVHGEGSYDYLYVGASIKNSSGRWQLGIFRVNHSVNSNPPTSWLARLDYTGV